LEPLTHNLVLTETVKPQPVPVVRKRPPVDMVAVERWMGRRGVKVDYELKMVAFLAMLDHKVASKEAFK